MMTVKQWVHVRMCLLSTSFQTILQFPRPAATLVLLGIAFQSSALTIGRPQGAAWIGKPLDVTVPLTLEEAEGGGNLCLEAEVLQGDSRLEDKRVSVSFESGSSSRAPRARVRSTVAIDEPVVTVTLRAGCDTRSSRRFVMFADLPVDAAAVASARAPAPTPAVLPAPAQAPVPVRAESSRSAIGNDLPSAIAGTDRRNDRVESGSGDVAAPAPQRRVRVAPRVETPATEEPIARAPVVAPPPPRARVAASAPVVRPPVRAPAPLTKPAPPPAPAETKAPAIITAPPAREEAVAGGSRLQVDAMEPSASPGREGQAKQPPVVAAPVVENSVIGAAAASPAVGTVTETLQREAQQLQGLESAINLLREQTVQTQQSLAALRGELAQARDSRYRNPLVYALLGLLLLTLLAIGLMWRALRRARTPTWWGEGPDTLQAQHSSLNYPLPDEPRVESRGQLAPGSTFGPPDPDDEDLMDAAAAPSLVVPHPGQRMVSTEELFDVQQQSDFFLSLGQHEQAIAVLKDHVAVNPDTSALAYLDLLKIYHSLGRKDEYENLRQDFSRNFNAGVPEFELFDKAGRGLEHYGSTLARIEAQWPSAGTLPLIEDLVFRKQGAQGEDSFDLPAYRELLLLYSVAKEVIDPDSAPPAPMTPLSYADTNFGNTQMTTAPAPLGDQPVTRAGNALGGATGGVPVRLEAASAPPLDSGPTLPTPLFGLVGDAMQGETVMAPASPAAGANAPPRPRLGREMDLSEADRTAYATLPSPLEGVRPPPGGSSNVIDYELFDPATEAEIAPDKPPTKS